ncbi:MAG: trigger factor [Trichloromonadaceae bacterium]
MNVKIEDISSVRKKLSIEVPEQTVTEQIGKAYQKIGKTAKVKGFRPGKVPQAMLEKYYGAQMEEQVLTKLINDTYFKALVEHKIAAISDPEIVENSPLEKGKPFAFEALVEVRPDVVAKDYAGLTLKKEKAVFDEKVITERIEELRTSRAELQPSAAEVAAEGDFAVIDFEGFVNDTPFQGGQAEGHQLELGSGSFIPGFEDQVVGMKLGEAKEVAVTFPENYGNKDLAGQPAIFKVVLHELKTKVAPALDDEFAKGFGLESVDELKEKLRESHQKQDLSRIDGDLRERLVSELIKRNPIEVPESMVKSQLEYMLGNVKQRMQSQGMTMEMLGMNEASFGQMYRDTAVQQVQGSLILAAVARQEKIAVEPTEIDGKLEEIAGMANAPLDAVKKYYASDENRRGLMAQIVEEKAVRLLLDQAVIEEVQKDQLAAADKE